jgi:hypothetical protein
MVSITDLDITGACDTCGGPTEDLQALQRRAGDDICVQCDSLFTAAHALLDKHVRDEPTIRGTLAFAWSRAANSEGFGGLELVSSVDGVPLLRLPRITMGVITNEGSRVPKAAGICVYSRDVPPRELAQRYERLLRDHGIHFDKCSAGSVEWDIEDAKLTLTVRAMKELDSWRVSLCKTYPGGRIYAFPPPPLVSGFYRTLLGSTDKRTFSGYAYVLAESGHRTPLKVVTASVACLLGEKSDSAIRPRERRPRIAKTLNKHLLAPRGEQKLLEDSWIPDDTVWRDARLFWPRLMRNLYHLQEGFKQHIP